MRVRPSSIFALVVSLLVIVAPLAMFPPAPNAEWQAEHLPQPGAPLSDVLLKTLQLPGAYTVYFNDHSFLQQEKVEIFRFLKLHALRDTVFPNVVIGKENWLYYTGENNIRDYECTFMFNSEEMAAIQENLMAWEQHLAERGILFYVVIAPNKETIYSQYVPDHIQPGLGICRTEQVVEMLAGTRLRYLDLREPLQEAAKGQQVYHRTDTHWNDRGALLASAEILRMVQGDIAGVHVPSADDFVEEEQTFSGDLAAMLPADRRFVEETSKLHRADAAHISFVADGTGASIGTNRKSSLATAIIFGDSFSDALIPFLAEGFSEARFVRSFRVDVDRVDAVRPDVVILEVVQRYLPNLR